MKLAYFVIPHIGGTYSVFKHLRKGLAAYDIDVRWLGVCKETYGLPSICRVRQLSVNSCACPSISANAIAPREWRLPSKTEGSTV